MKMQENLAKRGGKRVSFVLIRNKTRLKVESCREV